MHSDSRPANRRVSIRCALAGCVGMLISQVALGQVLPWTPPMPSGPTAPPSKVIKGPVGNGTYIRVLIESDSVGLIGDQIVLIESTVRAPVCVRTPGRGVTIKGNNLDCALCVEFTSQVIVGNTLVANRCAGRGTNRPDVFGW